MGDDTKKKVSLIIQCSMTMTKFVGQSECRLMTSSPFTEELHG